MNCSRTFPNHKKILLYYRSIFIFTSLAGYSIFPLIPYFADFTPGNNTIDISCVWKKVTPQTMASRITIPIEDALSMLDDIKEIHSSSGSGYANIQVTLHSAATNQRLTKILSQIRHIRNDLHVDMTFPIVKSGSNTITSFVPVISTGDKYPGSIKLWENKTKQFIGGIKGLHPEPTRPSDTTDYVLEPRFSTSTTLGKSLLKSLKNATPELGGAPNLLIPHGKGMIPPSSLSIVSPSFKQNEPARFNALPSLMVPLRFKEDRNPLVTRLKTFIKLNNLLKLLPGSHPLYGVVGDPYKVVINGLLIRIIRICGLLILLVILSYIFQSNLKYTFTLLLLPGFFLLLIWTFSFPLTDIAFHWMEVTIVAGALLGTLPMGRETYFGLGIIFAGILFFYATPFLPAFHVSDTTSLLLSLATIILYGQFQTAYIPRGMQPSVLPFPWLSSVVVLFMLSPFFYGNSDEPGIFQKVLNNKKEFPSDPPLANPEIKLTARLSSSEDHLELKQAVEAIRYKLKALESDFFLEYSPNKFSYIIILRFNEHSPAQLLAKREQIIPLLSAQKGIQWQFQGIGEVFQNNHLIVPGSYGFRIKGYDYDQALTLAQAVADSLKELPGIGLVRVDQDEYSDNPYFVLKISPTGPYTDSEKIIHSLFEGLEHRNLMTDSVVIQQALYGEGKKKYQGKQFLSLEEVVGPAPVRRLHRQYILDVNYTHYGGEKYATEFHENLIKKLHRKLPAGYEIHEESDQENVRNHAHIYLAGICISCLSAMFLVTGFDRKTMFTCIMSLFFLVYIFCYHTGYPLSSPILSAFQASVIAACILLSLRGRTLLYGMVMIILWNLIHLFLYTSGEEYLFAQAFAVLNFGLLLMIFTERVVGKLITRRGYRTQKLLNFLRLGMIAQFFKRINKVS